jgi:hypothetical protein
LPVFPNQLRNPPPPILTRFAKSPLGEQGMGFDLPGRLEPGLIFEIGSEWIGYPVPAVKFVVSTAGFWV